MGETKEVKCPQLPEFVWEEERAKRDSAGNVIPSTGKLVKIKCESSIVDKQFCDTFVFGRGCGHKKTCSAYALLCEKDEKPIAKSDEFVIGEKDGT